MLSDSDEWVTEPEDVVDWNDIPTYTYTALRSSDSIRLLCIEPGDDSDQIVCSLVAASFDEESGYEALSYVWGPEEPTQNIICDGKRHTVRQNLFDALSNFRLSDNPR
jgi:hypothetical protein